jgi:hypothetical protein
MSSFENRFFIDLFNSWILIRLGLISNFSFINFTFSPIPVSWFKDEIVVWCMITASFMKAIAF